MAVNATAIWRVRPSGSNTNGGGYDPGISGAATDYSQQNSAQASGTHGTTTGTTTFVDATANAFTAAMVGNAVYITGTGQTTGFYFVTAYSSASTVTLDRSPGTGTLATWHLGGGWADFWTNPASTGPLVAGNTVYILGSGTPNPASYTFDYILPGSTVTLPTPTTAYITFANDPSTPSYKAAPDTTGGMPCIKQVTSASFNELGGIIWSGLWFSAASSSTGSQLFGSNSSSATVLNANIIGCVYDQFGQDVTFETGLNLFASEIFSSVAPGSAGTKWGCNLLRFGANIKANNNIHDCVGNGIGIYLFSVTLGSIVGNIIAKNGGSGIVGNSAFGSTVQFLQITGNTIDGNGADGIDLTAGGANNTVVFNNIISNHTQAGKYAINISGGSQLLSYFDWDVFYNNTTNYNGVSAGPHDTALGSNPYNGQSTEDYSLK